MTDDFIRDLDEAIGDIIDKHFDSLHLHGGYELWTIATEAAILAIVKQKLIVDGDINFCN